MPSPRASCPDVPASRRPGGAALRAAALLGAMLLIGATPRARAADPTPRADATLDGLMLALRSAPGVEARFHEKRVIALLAAPLESEGTLHFSPPGLLARHVTRPTPAFQIIDARQVRLGDSRGVEVLDLANNPHVRAFVESFVLLLAGDRVALERTYRLTFEPESTPAHPGTWRLRLVPLAAPLDKVIASIELEGAGLVLRAMRVAEVGGDETLTTFSHVDTKRVYTSQERTTLFRLGP